MTENSLSRGFKLWYFNVAKIATDFYVQLDGKVKTHTMNYFHEKFS